MMSDSNLGDSTQDAITDQPLEDLLSRAAHQQHQAIASRAHEIFLKRGSGDGHALRDWLQAKREIFGHFLI